MAVNGSYYGRERFDPLLILAQIVLLQSCFYASYLLLLLVFNRATGTIANVTDQIFNYTFVTLRHFPGWVTCTALLISAAGPTALAFVAVVGRAKRCIDFACTLLISHIIATSLHSGFPVSFLWWLLHVIATAALATVGEMLSLRVELRDIALARPDVPDTNPSRCPEDDQSRDIEAALRPDTEPISASN